MASTTRIAIIGGGPGGLMTSYLLQKEEPESCEITLFEASNRLGGKLKTGQFKIAPVRYEAGAAELYDYSQLGPDPLKELVQELGLATRPLAGKTVVMDDEPLKTEADVRRKLGKDGYAALQAFGRKARSLITPQEYYESDWQEENKDPLAEQRFDELLSSIPDPSARRYVLTAIHSDLATEPHLTNAMYGLQNFLMNEPGYMRLYAIDGGNERLAKELARRITGRVLLRHRVDRVEKTPQGTYQVTARHKGQTYRSEFDFVVAALPNNWLTAVNWGGAALAQAVRKHHDHYDHPAHYLRVSVLFQKPFWREVVAESYFMLDTFDGCCVYDETSRTDESTYGVLGWLLGGEAALTMSNFENSTILDQVLDSLPSCLAHGRDLVLESHVNRWVGAINGMPGGFPLLDPLLRHRPDPVGHPGLFLVGDYLFDATLNGVLDSAETVVDCIVEAMDVDDAPDDTPKP